MLIPNETKLSYSDHPRHHYSEDLLGYKTFAYRLANAIQKIPCRNGTTIGLYGQWGSGKTTLLNFVQAYLRDLPPAEQPIIVPFNPWWFSGEDEMASKFFESLLGGLNDAGVSHDILTSLKAISEIVAEVPFQFSWIGKTGAKILSKFSASNLPKLREQAATQLRNQRRKILVIIDDVDRLLPNELLTMFKLTKMIGDLPNVVCLLSMDKKAVMTSISRVLNTGSLQTGIITGSITAKALSGQATFSQPSDLAEDYLEKIIQVPFDLPTPDADALNELFSEALYEIFADDADDELDVNYFSQIYVDGIRKLFDTPRKLTRLRNAAIATYASVRGEVHFADFIALESLRIMCPDVYQIVRDNGVFFFGSTKFDSFDSPPLEQTKNFHLSWLAQVKTEQREPIEIILRTIFPKVEKCISKRVTMGLPYPTKHKLLLARHKNKFPIYFGYTVPSKDMSNLEMMSIIYSDEAQLGERLIELTQIVKPNGSSRFLSFLETLDDYLSDLKSDVVRRLITVMLNLGDKLNSIEDYGKGFLGLPIGNQQRMLGLLYRLLNCLLPDERFDLLKRILPKTALGISAYLIFYLNEKRNDQVQNRQTQQKGDALFSKKQMNELINLLMPRMKNATKDEILLNSGARIILAAWSDWDSQSLRKWTKLHISSLPSLVHLLNVFSAARIYDWQTLDSMFELENLESQFQSNNDHDADWLTAKEYLKKCILYRNQQKVGDFDIEESHDDPDES